MRSLKERKLRQLKTPYFNIMDQKNIIWACLGLAVVSVFLPWVGFFGISASGIQIWPAIGDCVDPHWGRFGLEGSQIGLSRGSSQCPAWVVCAFRSGWIFTDRKFTFYCFFGGVCFLVIHEQQVIQSPTRT